MARKRPLRKSPAPPSPLSSPSPPSAQEKDPEKENVITKDEHNKEEMNTDNVEDDKEEEEDGDDDDEMEKKTHVGKFTATIPSPSKSDSGSDSDNHFTIKPVASKLTAPKPPTKRTTEKAVPGGCGVELVLGLACEGWELGVKKPKRTSNGRLKTADKKTEVKTTDSLKSKVTTEEKGDEVEEHPALNEWLDMGDVPEGVRWVVRKRLRQIEKGKLKALEERWRNLRKAELELFVQRMDLVSEQLKLVLDADL